MKEPRNEIFDWLGAVPPFWNFLFSKHLGTKTTIIYRGLDIHVNLYWFLAYHPEDTKQDSRKIEDEPSKLSVLFVNPRGFNKILLDIFPTIPRMALDMNHLRVTERIAFDNKKSTAWLN